MPPYPRAFARAVFSARDASLPLLTGVIPAQHSHGLHRLLLKETILIYLALCPAVLLHLLGSSDSEPPCLTSIP